QLLAAPARCKSHLGILAPRAPGKSHHSPKMCRGENSTGDDRSHLPRGPRTPQGSRPVRLPTVHHSAQGTCALGVAKVSTSRDACEARGRPPSSRALEGGPLAQRPPPDEQIT